MHLDIQTAFDNAWHEFKENPSFWVLGHAFDTMVDCLVLCPPEDPQKQNWICVAEAALKKLMILGLVKGDKLSYATGEAWYDDDGWWVIAALKAYKYAHQLGWDKYKGLFRDFCLDKWQRFTNAANVWDHFGGSWENGSICPVVKGGVWNSGWPKDSTGGPCEPWAEFGMRLGGFQNTVTNSLFLVAAQRLYEIARNDPWLLEPKTSYSIFLNGGPRIPSDFLVHANREFKFFGDWFGFEASGVLQTTLNRLKSPYRGAVVRERVSAYQLLPPARGYVSTNDYQEQLAWAGDQGLMLGAMVDRVDFGLGGTIAGGTPEQLARDIVDGAMSYLDDGHGMLLNWRSKLGDDAGYAPGRFPRAYATGFGAFMRYFTQAYLSPTLNGHMAGYKDKIQAMLALIGTSQTYKSQCEGASPLTTAINVLALSVAATVCERAVKH